MDRNPQLRPKFFLGIIATVILTICSVYLTLYVDKTLGALYWAIPVSLTTCYLSLKLFVTSNKYLAVFSTAATAVFGVYVLQVATQAVFPEISNPLIEWLVIGAFLIAALCFHLFLFGKLLILRPVYTIIICIALCLFYVFVVSSVLDKKSSLQYAAEEQKVAKNLKFTLYKPTYAPTGYTFESAALQDLRISTIPPYYELTYSTGYNELNSPRPYNNYSLFVFDDSSGNYNPPSNCGSLYPSSSNESAPCIQIGTNTEGKGIFVYRFDRVNIYQVYTQIGNSLVTLDSKDKNFSDEEAAKILSSLKPVTLEETGTSNPDNESNKHFAK